MRRELSQYARSGFTLIELLVVIAIIAIMTGVVVVNNRTTQQRAALDRIAQKIISDIREMENAATAAQTIRNPNTENSEVPEGGYGVHVNKADVMTGPVFSYDFFADFNSDRAVDFPLEGFQGIQVPQGFKIQAVYCGDPPGPCTDNINIVFFPPDPVLLLHYDSGNPIPQGVVYLDVMIPSGTDCSGANKDDCRRITIKTTGEITASILP